MKQTHVEWHAILEQALKAMDPDYLSHLVLNKDWLPGRKALLAAFRLPLSSTRYILFGESPYPREESANGYAFWDQGVDLLWSESGLSKKVNRATSLRNLIKMLLVARGDLTLDVSQEAIAALDKSSYVSTVEQLFQAFLDQGILLLNASLVYSKHQVAYHARQWRPFMDSLTQQLSQTKSTIQLILFGTIAKQIPKTELTLGLLAEHPYNVSFIRNPLVLEFFKPMDLLRYHDN